MALIGFWMNGVCYATQAEAVTAFVSLSPSVNGQYLTTFNAIPSGLSSIGVSLNTMDLSLPANVFVPHAATIPLRACDSLVSVTSFNDGMQIGWGIVAAMLAALSIVIIKKSFFL